jgi:transcriptional regulator with XRE-family HTH domain
MKKFGDRLGDELLNRGMKPADLTRLTGLDSGVLSNLLNNKRQPAVETCKIIAKALEIPLEEVYIWAEILPPKPDRNPYIAAVENLMGDLSSSDNEEVLEYVRLKHRLKKRANVKENTKRNSRRTAEP